MNKWQKIIVYTAAAMLISFSASCSKSKTPSQNSKSIIPDIDLDSTIGSLADTVDTDIFPVEGYNLVGGLHGTGSADCPDQIRDYLTKYIQTKLPKMNVEEFLASPDTAVVRISGAMPTSVSSSPYFDVKVEAMPGTQTTSLKGGSLYGAELKSKGGFLGTLPVLAQAEGPVFINPFDDSDTGETTGYILAGGTRIAKFKMSLTLKNPDFKVANYISNRLRARFGDETAEAVSPGKITLTVPAKYSRQQERFIEIVKAMYLADNPELTQQRIKTYIRKLGVSENGQGQQSEIILETIGNESLEKLEGLLNLSNEMVRLRAARCMLNLGSNKGLSTLREIASDLNSEHRIEALEAITASANKKDASAISRRLLRDGDFKIRLAAYKQLKELDDIAITKIPVAKNFLIELIPQAMQKDIYVSRSGERCIVIFAAPIECVPNTLVSSDDGNIMITTEHGSDFVWVIRKHPTQPDKIVKLKSSLKISDILETLCQEPPSEHSQRSGGLGVSYDDVIALLKKMCDKGLLPAEFHAGPLPEIASN